MRSDAHFPPRYQIFVPSSTVCCLGITFPSMIIDIYIKLSKIILKYANTVLNDVVFKIFVSAAHYIDYASL